MKNISTAKILLDWATSAECGQDCVDWALGMLEQGKDSTNLRVLAGAVHPYNHFELAELRDLALIELNVKPLDLDVAVNAYACERLRAAINGSDDFIRMVISELKDVCIATDYHKTIFPFYLLFFAYDDLQERKSSEHLKDATRENIMIKMRDAADAFLKEHCSVNPE